MTAYAAEDYTATTSTLVGAIERVWIAVQRRHADVPNVVVTMSSGVEARRPLKLGHFAPRRWTVGEQKDVHELFIGGEGLQRGAVELLDTVLHEAAHAVAHERGVKDTSRQGRWHNAKFAEIARELGLDVAHSKSGGWTVTTMPVPLQVEYATELVELDVELRGYRQSADAVVVIGGGAGGEGGTGGGSDAGGETKPRLRYECRCGRRIRIAREVFEAGPIICGICGCDFELIES